MDDHKVEIKEKPWGREIWFAHTEKYAGKILEIAKGHRYSLQYHEKKQEKTMEISQKIFKNVTSVVKLITLCKILRIVRITIYFHEI